MGTAMQGTFHWLRVQAFCYATEDETRVREALEGLLGGCGFETTATEGEHGNRIVLMEAVLKKQREFDAVFGSLRPVIPELIGGISDRVDGDCVFRTRLDKQELVRGRCVIAHHGDVVSVTGKAVSHPARKEIAETNLVAYLEGLQSS